MSTISFHQAEEYVKHKIKMIQQGAGSQALPDITFKLEEQKAKVSFPYREGIDLYSVIHSILESYGPMNITTTLSGVLLDDKETRIWLNNSFSHYFSLDKKDGELNTQELETIVQAYRAAHSDIHTSTPFQRLQSLGVRVYDEQCGLDWDVIAGYEQVKQELHDTIVLPLQHPEAYERMVLGTRRVYESIRPKAVLFEGPPGTGKTTCARILAGVTGIPLAYIPLESVVTKWYGESERNLAAIFDACKEQGDMLMFLDEIDSLGLSRDSMSFEANRKVLSVLLRKIDGFEANENTILIGATNRKQDLDLALISRFDVSIYFHLPEELERASIFSNYAMHLNREDLEVLARESQGFSGRTIKDVCERVERTKASGQLRRQEEFSLPSIKDYVAVLKKHS